MLSKILLVDDDREFREEFKHCFGDYEIVEASNGDEALAILKKPNEIGLVILDVKMPGPSGTAVLARIKAIAPDLHSVILTGFSSESVAIEALRGRADDYIEKPYNIEAMRETLERYLDAAKGSKRAGPAISAGEKIEHVKEFIARNCFKKICLEDVAKAVSLCPKYLSRIFKETEGEGFSRYRLKVQMGKACELLVGGGYNVSQISDKLGYRNPESFVRQFKRMSGCTPTEYRAKHGAAKKKAGSK